MPCYLRISGDFDPGILKEAAPLDFEIRHRKGEKGRKGIVHEDALIQFVASQADFSDPDQQFEDVIRFVRRYGEEMKTFCRRPEFSNLVFDFGILFNPKYSVFCRTLPRKVVAAAAVCAASIEVSFYSVDTFGDGTKVTDDQPPTQATGRK
jgi:hypothetical protein